MQHMVVDVEPDVIIHQATALRRLGNNIRRFDELFTLTNRLRAEGTAALLTAAQAVGSPRLLAQSSAAGPRSTGLPPGSLAQTFRPRRDRIANTAQDRW